MHGQRVTKAMWSFERDVQLAVADQGLKSLRDSGRLQNPDGGSLPKKYPSVWRRWRTALQVLRQGRCHLVGERQFQGRSRLSLVNVEYPLSPCDIVQREFHHFAGPQAVRGDQEKHRVVAQPNVRREIKRLQ